MTTHVRDQFHQNQRRFPPKAHDDSTQLSSVCAEEEEEDSEEAENAFLHLYINVPAGPSLSQVLHDPEKRRKLGESTHTTVSGHKLVSNRGVCVRAGKAHLRRAVIRHEEAMRVHSLCKILRKMDILQDVLALTHRRSLDKYSQLDREDDFDETAEAPEIQCECL